MVNQTPEQKARDEIDKQLVAAGWVVLSKDKVNLAANKGVAVREYKKDVGPADYVLFVDRKPLGIIEAKSGIYGNLRIPVPDLEEQKQIGQQIESRLSVCDKLEADIEENLSKAEALRQSILKKAFEGRLLSEQELEACRREPDWEPAEKLLERIKNENNKK